MLAAIEPLIPDLVEWVMRAPRPCIEVMEVWRTSCPRLTVWEDAVDRGLVACERRGARDPWIITTPLECDVVDEAPRGMTSAAGSAGGGGLARWQKQLRLGEANRTAVRFEDCRTGAQVVLGSGWAASTLRGIK